MMAIYKIVNVLNKKEYVGSAKVFLKRKNIHLFDLRKNKHHSSKLQNSWNKYGESNFEFIIIEEVYDSKQLLIREQFWIDALVPHFNICRSANSPIGIKHTKKARENMRNSHLGKKLTKKAIKKRSLKQSGDNHWMNRPKNKNMRSKVLKNMLNSAKNRIGTKQSKERINNRIKKNTKPVFQFFLDGIFIKEWEGGAIQISKELNIPKNSIRRCCNGIRLKCRNFLWSYKRKK